MKRAVGVMVVVGALAAGHGAALGDRAISPTDALGDWAIDTTLLLGGPWQWDTLYTDDAGNVRAREISAGQIGLDVRVWPARGAFGGVRLSNASLGNDDHRDWAERNEFAESGWTDLELDGGIVHRPTRNLVLGGNLEVALPTGTGVFTYGYADVEVTGTLGFSFTPRWDFFFQPALGYRTEDDVGAREGARAGYYAGLAYQRPRFSLVGRGFNLRHFDANDSKYWRYGAQLAVGWEVYPGLFLGLTGDFSTSEQHRVLDAIPSQSFGDYKMLLNVGYVLYPGGKANELRHPDRQRGIDWLWWNPDPRGNRPAT